MVIHENYLVSGFMRFWQTAVGHPAWLVTVIAVTLSILTTGYYYEQGLLVAYGDAESHMNIAKRVVSSMTPGFGQLGGNWPPFHHVLMLPFVANDWMWRSGVGAAVVSMVCYVLSAVFIFKLIRLTLRFERAAWLGTLLFMVNPGVLYMQTTAMSELPMILSLVGAVYFFAKWTTNEHPLDIICSALFVFMGSLTRYDSWFLAVSCIAAMILIALVKQFDFKKTEGSVIFFSVISFAGIVLWIVWNQLIFNDPTYFMNSEYSAKSQQQEWHAKGQLPSYHDMSSSYEFYVVTMLHNTGYAAAGAAALGLITLLFYAWRRRYSRAHIVSLLLLATPFPFYVLTLYMGISIILIPELLPKTWDFNLFNARYGMMMIPFTSVLAAAVAAGWRRAGFVFVATVLAVQSYLFVVQGDHIVLADAKYGLSSRRPTPVNKYVADHYDEGYVMFDDFSRSANPIDLNIPMDQIVYVGNHPKWDRALEQPEKHVKWLIVRRDENDVLWGKFRNDPRFTEKYQLVHNWQKTGVYRRWDENVPMDIRRQEARKHEQVLKADAQQRDYPTNTHAAQPMR